MCRMDQTAADLTGCFIAATVITLCEISFGKILKSQHNASSIKPTKREHLLVLG